MAEDVDGGLGAEVRLLVHGWELDLWLMTAGLSVRYFWTVQGRGLSFV